jgi:hypothetical protein
MPTTFEYTHPTFTARRFVPGQTVATATATPVGQINFPVAADLFNAHFFVNTAGTSASAVLNWITISGTTTTTLGTTTAGTQAIGTHLRLNGTSSAVTPTAVLADTRAYVTITADATISGHVVWEYGVDPETAVLS